MERCTNCGGPAHITLSFHHSGTRGMVLHFCGEICEGTSVGRLSKEGWQIEEIPVSPPKKRWWEGFATLFQ